MIQPQLRSRELFDFDWKFHKGDVRGGGGGERMALNDSRWRDVQLPHDWSKGPFRKDAPGGGSHGWTPNGVWWYRKRFTLPQSERPVPRLYTIEFDGVYHNSDVWINGHHLGHRAYGYISFAYNLTPYLNRDGGENVLAVRVDGGRCLAIVQAGRERGVTRLSAKARGLPEASLILSALPSRRR